ncbi:hypothetical protein [Streptomyces sp. enrichment culture]|uniref:hypothetical protein n=1 Tax=Streptomyces sp. enrichment culture TaxID=1795815 RepID=UPI003F55FD8F
MGNHSTQRSAAIALVQLLMEHPTLPVAAWSIDSIIPTLHGHLHEGGMEALAAYADVLGGSIRAGHEYPYQGQRLRSHRLSTVWRDVRVEIAVALPVASAVAA